MKIERINENSIKCTLNKADLASFHIKLSELAFGTGRTKELFREMMLRASDECGFDADNIPLMIEAIPTSPDNIVLIITKVDNPDELDSRFTPLNMEQMDDIETTEHDSIPFPDDLDDEDFDFDSGAEIFSFSDLLVLIDAAKQLKGIFSGLSSLYKDKNGYLLVVDSMSENDKTFDYSCDILSEYADKQLTARFKDSYIQEHSDIILENDALKKLAEV